MNTYLVVDIRVPKVLLLNPGVSDPDTYELLQGHGEQKTVSGLWKGLEGAGRTDPEASASALAVPQETRSRNHESGITRVHETLHHKWKF